MSQSKSFDPIPSEAIGMQNQEIPETTLDNLGPLSAPPEECTLQQPALEASGRLEDLASNPSATDLPLEQVFAEERPGWRGYIEWEKYPAKKRLAAEILKMKKFTRIPEFQFIPLPDTNPILVGHRWKEYHEALGIHSIVDFSWETVQKEKPNIIHLLDFPYNGETTREQLLEGKLTDNMYHFIRNHGGVPDIDEDAFELEIGGLVNKPVKLSMKDLKDPDRFPQSEVTVTLQCSGTRRIEQIQQYPGDGDELINAPWGEGAIGTAVYRGVPLKKVLKKAN